MVRSSDSGKTWKPVGEPLPFKAFGRFDQTAGVAYSAATKTVFYWHHDCGNAVLPDAIMSAGFDASK